MNKKIILAVIAALSVFTVSVYILKPATDKQKVENIGFVAQIIKVMIVMLHVLTFMRRFVPDKIEACRA